MRETVILMILFLGADEICKQRKHEVLGKTSNSKLISSTARNTNAEEKGKVENMD